MTKWTVISSVPFRKGFMVRARCGKCGDERTMSTKAKLPTSAQCLRCRNIANRRGVPVGTVFNKWTTLADVVYPVGNGTPKVQARCECGVVHFVNFSNLRHGYSLGCRSCAKRVTAPPRTTPTEQAINVLRAIKNIVAKGVAAPSHRDIAAEVGCAYQTVYLKLRQLIKLDMLYVVIYGKKLYRIGGLTERGLDYLRSHDV